MPTKLDQVISDYLSAVDSGTAPPRDELLARHPDLAEQLAAFFAAYDEADPPAPSPPTPPPPADQAESAKSGTDSTQRLSGTARNFAGGKDGGAEGAGGRADCPSPLPSPQRGEGDDFATHRLAYVGPEGSPLGSEPPAGAGIGSATPRFGDYELLEELGRGAMGVVYKARQVSLNRMVAIKMILGGQFASEEQVRRFYAEAEAAAHLEHPGIVPIYEVGQQGGLHYYSMAYVAGQSLAARLAAGPVPADEAARLVRGVAEAIAYAHERGVIHRDLKPANILLTADGTPRVADFGLAKRLNVDSAHTHTGTVLGTPCYMAPEQTEGKPQQVGPPADIYALGAILYELLTGGPPFRAEQMHETFRQVREDEPRPPRRVNPQAPRDLETICLMCLAKAPGDRYASPQQLVEDLECFLAEQPLRIAHRAGWPARMLRACVRAVRRRPLRAAYTVLGGLALAFVAAMTIVNVLQRRGEFDVLLGQAQAAEQAAADAQRQGQRTKALEHYAKAQEKYAELIADYAGRRDVFGVQLSLAEVHLQRGIILTGFRELDAASEEFERAEEVVQALPEEHARWAERQLTLAEVFHNLGILHNNRQTASDCRRSLEFYEQARAVRAQLHDRDPENRAYRTDLARSYGYMGDTQLALGLTAEAWDSYEQARRLRQALVDEQADDLPAKFQLGRSKGNTGRYYEWLGQSDKALAAYREQWAYLSDLPMESPPGGFQTDGALACLAVARIELDLIEEPAALGNDPEHLLQRALGMLLKLQRGDERERNLQSVQARVRVNLGKYHLRRADFDAAEKALRQAVQLLKPLSRATPVLPEDEYYLAAAYALLSQLPPLAAERVDNEVAALQQLEQAIDDGYQNQAHLERDVSFRALRGRPLYRKVVEKLNEGRASRPSRALGLLPPNSK